MGNKGIPLIEVNVLTDECSFTAREEPLHFELKLVPEAKMRPVALGPLHLC